MTIPIPNDELKFQWKYYLEEAEQEPDVQTQLAAIREEYKALKPEDILCIETPYKKVIQAA